METNKHFILTDEFKINEKGIKLFRIKCIRKFNNINVGDLGGFIESYENLSDNAWVYDNAMVYDNAEVYGNAKVYGNAWVYDNAKVFGDAEVYDNTTVFGNAEVCGSAGVYGNTEVNGNAKIMSHLDYSCFQSFGIKGRTTTVFREKEDKIKIKCGCFSGSIEEFEKRVEEKHGDSKFGREYKAIINVIKVKFNLI